MAPAFLSLDEVLAIHADQLARYGGFDGLRDQEALNTALAAPEARMNNRWVHDDLAGMAAAYLYQLARYRPFVDANKRTAVAATLVFLALNGVAVTADPTELAELVRGAAAGAVDRPAVAAWLGARVTGGGPG